jgi:hypothetical protein
VSDTELLHKPKAEPMRRLEVFTGRPHPPYCSQSKKRTVRWPRSGAENWACVASLIETCKLNGVSTGLLHRCAHQAGQSLARLPHRRAHALGLGGRALDQQTRGVTPALARKSSRRSYGVRRPLTLRGPGTMSICRRSNGVGAWSRGRLTYPSPLCLLFHVLLAFGHP